MNADLLDDGHCRDAVVVKLHDPRLDLVMKPKVRRLALLLENAGPLPLRALARISNMSLQSVHGAVGLLKSSGLIDTTLGRGMLQVANEAVVRCDPIDEMPDYEYKACFVDVVKGLKSKCRAAVLLDNFDKTPLKILLLVDAGPEGPLGKLTPSLVELANNIRLGHRVQLHFIVANEIHMMNFLNAKRGVWPSLFARAAEGLVFIGALSHDGRSLFEGVQRVLTYPQEKIEELMESGTLVKHGDVLAFSDIGIRRYVRTGRIPALERVNSAISALL